MIRGLLERSAKSLLGVCSVVGADKPVGECVCVEGVGADKPVGECVCVWEGVGADKPVGKRVGCIILNNYNDGIFTTLDFEVVAPTTTSKAVSWREREGAIPGETPQFPIYLSKERRLALRLCGWSFEVGTLEDFLKRFRISAR